MIVIKNKEQIEGIRKSCKLATETLRFLGEHVKPGISTLELDELAVNYLKNKNAIHAPLGYKVAGVAYPKSICTSVNEVICHGIPSKEDVLKEGDIINIDVTTILNGYYGDTSKMFCVGEVSKEAAKLVNVAESCMHIGITTVQPNQCFGEIGKAITAYAERYGYSVVYQFCGHGVGLKFHEEPSISHDTKSGYDKTKMKPGMIFTIEPMINEGKAEGIILEDKWTVRSIDKKLSAQFEHTVLVTENGVEILTF
jgi:methionyl aminopeptidase